MNRRKILIATLVFLVLYARPLQGREKPDVIIMKNALYISVLHPEHDFGGLD
jgi:hypothetical protein